MKVKVWFDHPKGKYFIIEEWDSIEAAEEAWREDCPFFIYAEAANEH